MKRPPTRRIWQAAAVLLVAFVVAGFAGWPVYVKPQIDSLRKADAILVIGGYGYYERYTYGFELASQGWAPHLLLSQPGGPSDLFLTSRCSREYEGFTVECFRPDPPTTLGEARELRKVAQERNWKSVIVVTFMPHISRTRYIFEKCYDGELIMSPSPVSIPPQEWVWQYIYQTAGYIRSFVQGGC
ncbi:ElyC/SanA/YdcF family protein [Antrihabitans sp. YC2-6]|uniref:YdcF family protein n=1 Tax=Antrihabitans sp. YC2-6 TaxID=2799498 RepID=UPI0027DCD65F|nr:ElyC/SanA/YdcF family protein [Antrihabitans sp. YC2-6]